MADTKRRLGAALLAVIFGGLAAACGSADSDAGAAADGASTVPRPFPTTATTAEVPVTAPGTHTLEFRPVLDARPAPPGTTCEAVPLTPEISGTLYECKAGAAVAAYELGPVALDGRAVERADSSTNQGGQSVVSPLLTETGILGFNVVAAACYDRQPTCPTGQLAVVLDDQVLMAPVVQQPSFGRDQIQISGSVDSALAADVAARINSARNG